jgi:type II secretory pathway pseudopilin PulG
MINQKPFKNSAGFTLLEVAVSTAIMLAITLGVVKFWITTSEAFTIDSNMVILKQQSERAMEIMAERIRRADPDSAGGLLALSNGDTAIDFIDGSGAAVRYELQPLAPIGPAWGQIVQTLNGTQNVIAGYVQNLTFSVSATGLITVTATFRMGSGRAETQLTTEYTVSPRN